MAGVSVLSDSPASTRPRSQPRRASRAMPAATAARPTRTVAAIRPRTPTVSAQSLGSKYTPASLEPIADLGKREMLGPGGGHVPPKPGSPPPGTVAARLGPPRCPEQRMDRPARLGLAEALPDQVLGQILGVIHVARPPCTTSAPPGLRGREPPSVDRPAPDSKHVDPVEVAKAGAVRWDDLRVFLAVAQAGSRDCPRALVLAAPPKCASVGGDRPALRSRKGKRCRCDDGASWWG